MFSLHIFFYYSVSVLRQIKMGRANNAVHGFLKKMAIPYLSSYIKSPCSDASSRLAIGRIFANIKMPWWAGVRLAKWEFLSRLLLVTPTCAAKILYLKELKSSQWKGRACGSHVGEGRAKWCLMFSSKEMSLALSNFLQLLMHTGRGS